ncbi:MAG: hypothetical protein LBU53_10180 [Zoogloeaceae bacterium]|jgi:hypothetical protein|nr:hypothetical protein [Zoogloeaceae bacterium]
MLDGTATFLKSDFMSAFVTIGALVMVVSAICAFIREMNPRWIFGMGVLIAFVMVFFIVSGGNFGLVSGFLVALVVTPFFVLFFAPLLGYELYIITRWKWSWLARIGCLVAPFVCCIALIEMRYSEKVRASEEEKMKKMAIKDYFDKKCAEDSGYFIYKEVKTPQESIFIMKPSNNADLSKVPEQFRMDDPYSDGSLGKPALFLGKKYYRYVGEELIVSSPLEYEALNSPFAFVEMRDTETKELWRYTLKPTGRMAKPSERDKSLLEAEYPELDVGSDAIISVESSYGIRWEDLSTPEDRQFWVAKNRLQIIELQTNEVIAERIGYVSGIRKIWGMRWPHKYEEKGQEPHRCPVRKDDMTDIEWIASVLMKTPFLHQEAK